MRRIASVCRPTTVVGLLLLGSLASLPGAASGEAPAGAWWEAETAMDQDSRIALTTRPWWQRAQGLAVGEHVVVQSTEPGGGRMLVRREQWTTRGKPQQAIVWVIDDDGDMKPDDKDGDKDSDCYVADYDADGTVDRMVDYLDNNGDGKPDEMEIRYYDGGRLRRAWFAMDLDGDGHMWKIDRYEYPPGSFFECDAYGDNMIYFNGYDPERRAWFPASECPFSFHDTDGDGQSEAVVRASGVPLSFDPANNKDNKDPANDVNYSSAPRTDATRDMGAMNVRYGIDVDGLSDAERPLHYDLGFNLIGRLPYRFEGMEHANPLRREPKTTICIPHASARAMAESYPADQTGFSWREFSDASVRIGFGPLADEDRRWEGIFWLWGRRVMHNTGGPVQVWNMRREFQPTPSTRRVLYYSRVDRRIHLKGAVEGWIQVGHLVSQDALGEVRWFDTNGDGYFDRWEVYREGQPAPVRVTTVLDPGVRELPSEWDKLTELYTKELLPEARQANQRLMAAMRRMDLKFAGSEELASALASAPSQTEKRYVEDIIREEQYLALRAKLLAQSAAWLAKDAAREPLTIRQTDVLADSEAAWELTRRIARLDVAYGEGRYDEAVAILDALPGENRAEPSQGVWYTPGVAEKYGEARPDKSVPSEQYARVYPGKPTVYSGPMATYCAWHRPMAVYAATEDKTFFVFGNARNRPTVSFFDHGRGAFGPAVTVGSNPNGDAHRNPTLLIDERGYLYVFYGAHGHPTHVVRSASPYDVSRWDARADIEDRNTYPQPWQLRPDEIFVSYRGTPPGWCFRKSTDGAASWTPPVRLIQFGDDATYAVSVAESGAYPRKLHLAWERMGGGTPEEIRTKALWARRYNVYYARSDDGGATWRRSDGGVYELPISEAAAEKIYDSGEHGVWLKDIQLDSRGNPLILFIDADVATYDARWKLARRSAAGWLISDVARSDHMYDGGALVVLSDDDLRVYAPTTASQDHEDGGEIDEWRSADGGAAWTLARHVTTGSPYSHNHVKTVFNHRRGDFRVMWSYGDSVYPPTTTDVFLYRFGETMDAPARMHFAAAGEPVARP